MDCGVYTSRVVRTNEGSKRKPSISVSVNGERLLPSPSHKSSANSTCCQVVAGFSRCGSVSEAAAGKLESCQGGSQVVIHERRFLLLLWSLFAATMYFVLMPIEQALQCLGRRSVDILRTDRPASAVEVFC